MYRVDRNNFFDNPKNSTIYTPNEVSQFLFDLLKNHISSKGYIFDPCVGRGSLLNPWKKAKYKVYGVDIKNQGFVPTLESNYLTLTKKTYPPPIV